MPQVQKKIEIIEYSQDEDFFWQKGIDYDAEGWEDTDWETHEPSIDPSPFEEIEWKELSPPPANIATLMKGFEKAGYEILVVGGAIRVHHGGHRREEEQGAGEVAG